MQNVHIIWFGNTFQIMRPQKTQLLDISDFAWPVLFEQQQKQLLW